MVPIQINKDAKYTGCGKSSIVYQIEDTKALNIFYKKPYLEVERIFNLMRIARENEIHVPFAEEINYANIDFNQFRKISIWDRYKLLLYSQPPITSNIIGKNFPVLKRQFISGINLETFILPKKEIREKINKEMLKMKKARIKSLDLNCSNYILTHDNELYLIDCENLYLENEIQEYMIKKLLRKKPPICKTQQWFVDIIASFF
ncbi:MAG: hypothetical protein ACOYT4_03425 [Nanoarchaeota archaeon]